MNNPMTDQQYKEFLATCEKAAREGAAAEARSYLDKNLDKGIDYGADDGLGTHVSGESNSLNQIVATIPATTTLSASLLWWGDLINQNIGITANVVIPVSGSNATLTALLLNTSATTSSATGTLAFQPPLWLTGGTGPGNLTFFQTYQLAVSYLAQNVAVFESLNIQSSEAATQAPVLQSTQIAEVQVSPYGLNHSNNLPLLNATTPQDFKSNQIIPQLNFPMSLFHYATLTTQVAAPSGGVSLTMTFNAVYREKRGTAFAHKVLRKGASPTPGARLLK